MSKIPNDIKKKTRHDQQKRQKLGQVTKRRAMPTNGQVSELVTVHEKHRVQHTDENRKIHSMFSGVYCRYDYEYDDSYVKWLVTDTESVIEPLVEDLSAFPRSSISIKGVKEILKNAKMPTDYLGDAASTQLTESEEDIVVL